MTIQWSVKKRTADGCYFEKYRSNWYAVGVVHTDGSDATANVGPFERSPSARKVTGIQTQSSRVLRRRQQLRWTPTP